MVGVLGVLMNLFLNNEDTYLETLFADNDDFTLHTKNLKTVYEEY
jgi:hypothetical protein